MHVLTRAVALAALLALSVGASAQNLRAPALYPNPLPADGVLTLEVDDASSARAEVLDVLGRRVSLDGPLAAGTYLVRAVYADGRATAPARFTAVATGRVEIRFAEAGAPLAPEAEGVATPEAAVAKGLGCSPGNVTFGGFQHTILTDGSLRVRGDLQPKTLRAQPSKDFQTVDFSTCFGEAKGYAFRYVDEASQGNRSLRVLSPANVGNTQVSYSASYTVDGTSGLALYGTFEQSIDNDGDPGTATVPAVAIGFDADYTPPAATQIPAAKMGGGYQIVVLDGETVVFTGSASDATQLFATPTGGRTRVNLLRSILLTSAVSGFDLDGVTKPGQISTVLTFESDDSGPVNFHLGEGAPVATGTSVHITPSVLYTDPSTFTISDVRTYATGLNRFGIRAMQFAAGGSGGLVRGPGAPPSGIAQWGRLLGEYTENQQFDILDAENPFMFIGEGAASPLSTPIPDYGILWGREPAPLQENASEEIDIFHGFPFTRGGGGGGGYIVDEDGEFYQTISQVRNETDNQSDAITVRFERVAGEIQITVDARRGQFSDYAFRYENDSFSLNRTYDVGVTNTFAVPGMEVFITGAVDIENFASSATQDFFVGYQVDVAGLGQGTIFITPNWNSDFADIDVRSHGVETDAPHGIGSVTEFDDQPDSKTARTSRWSQTNR